MSNPIYIVMPDHTGDATASLDGSAPLTISEYGMVQAAITLSAFGGRVNEYDDLASVDGARLVQQYDGTATLHLNDQELATTLSGTTKSGNLATINVVRRESKGGWAPAAYYMLERDEANEDLIIEPGSFYRDIYISNLPDAMTKATIAAHWNAANGTTLTESSITAEWLIDHPQYGGSADLKVDPTVGALIYNQHTTDGAAGMDKIRASSTTYLECSDAPYTGLTLSGTSESPLHPRVVRQFGAGTQPFGFNYSGNNPWYPAHNVMIGVNPNGNSNRMSFEDWLTADARVSDHFGCNATHRASGMTMYRTRNHNDDRGTPINGADNWRDGLGNRWSGTYTSGVKGNLFLDSWWDLTGWALGYSRDIDPATGKFAGKFMDGSGYGPQPPSQFSHNMYTQYDNADSTWENLLSMRSASVAGQLRSGGWMLGNTGVDNQIGYQNSSRRYNEDVGEKTGFAAISVKTALTSGRFSENVPSGGARDWGLDHQAVQNVDIDCLVLHFANPDDPAEITRKNPDNKAIPGGEVMQRPRGNLWDNFVAYGWQKNINIVGLSEAFMKQITIQRYAGTKMTPPVASASIAEYGDYLRTLTPRQYQLELRELNRYILSAREANMELPLDQRTVPQTLIFKADYRGEGFRSDMPYNWNTGDTPISGDSLDLHGNAVKWIKESRSLVGLTLGGGSFEVNSGKVSFDTIEAGAKVKTSYCGKLYVPAFDGEVENRGGRFAVTSPSFGSVVASGRGQMILGPDWTVRDGETFSIVGDMGLVGWDRISGNGVLRIAAGGTLEFEATPVLQFGNVSTSVISQGHYMTPWDFWHEDMLGQTSGASGKFDSIRRKGTMKAHVRIRDAVGVPVVGEYTLPERLYSESPRSGLIEAIHPATIGKIEAGWAGRLGTVNTTATFQVILEAGSFLKVKNRDRLDANTYDLGGGTGTRVTFVDEGATKDAGFTVTSGKLTLAI